MPSAHQHSVLTGTILAFLMVATSAALAVHLPPLDVVRTVAPLFVWAYSATIIGLWLMVLIGKRALQRFVDPTQTEGGIPNPASADAIDARVLQNTLEQTVIALLAGSLLAISHATHANMLLLVHAALFSLGRSCFWIGYHRSLALRAYGFALGFTATLGIYGYAVQFLLRALL